MASYKTPALTTQKRMALNIRQWVAPEVATAKCNAPSSAAGWPRDTAWEQTTQLPAPSPAAPGPASPSTAQTVRSFPKQTGAQTPSAERGTGALLQTTITTAGVRAAEAPTLVQPKICI